MNNRRPAFRVLFILAMFAFVGTFIWYTPASTSLNRTIADRRNELSILKAQLVRQEQVDHVRNQNNIRAAQEKLDSLLTPELSEYWLLDKAGKTLLNEKSILNSTLKKRKAEKNELEELLNAEQNQEDAVHGQSNDE